MAFQGLYPLTTTAAAKALAKVAHRDPRGTSTPESLAAAGSAFEMRTDDGGVVIVVKKIGAQLWIEAAAGKSKDDMTAMGLAVIEGMARGAGCTEVAFQTARPGLLRKVVGRRGYKVAGWILKKEI